MFYQYFELKDKHVALAFDGTSFEINDRPVEILTLSESHYGNIQLRLYMHTDEAIYVFDVTDGLKEIWDDDNPDPALAYCGIVRLFDISNQFDRRK